MSEFWAWRPFTVGVKRHGKPLGDTKKVLAQARALRARSPLHEYDALAFAGDVIDMALFDTDIRPSDTIMLALVEMLEQIYFDEALSPVEDRVLSLRPNSRDAIAVREYLRRQIRFIENYAPCMKALKDYMSRACRLLMTSIPIQVLVGDTDQSFLTTRFADLLGDVAEVIDTVLGSSFEEDLRHLTVLEPLRNRYEKNVMQVSKIDPRQPPSNPHRYVTPIDAKNMDDAEIVENYLIGTPFRHVFNTEVPLPMNEQARFEHSHILGGTGHGKTQFIQKWIIHDLEAAQFEKRSIVVIDSQGDLIHNIARLDCFHPDHGSLRDKLIIIDPHDVQFPAAINMFAMDEKRLASYGLAEREKVQNAAIALYEHFFGELLGAELTAKQGVVFKYLARLMLEIPNATILTLRDLVDDPTPFIQYMDKLEGSARVFFAREFLDKSFNQTRKQISKRLWAVLSTPAFERLFSSTETKIDLFSKMNDGSVILISTAKDLLKQKGTSLYGRFFLSMIGQAIMERAALPEHKRTPTFLYIDECQDYFDETVEVLLAQGRKMKIGITLAHQFMDQMDTTGRSSILANTSIKAVGGMNAKDAKALAAEMRVSPDYLHAMQKNEWGSDFAFWMKHDLPNAIKVTVPFGYLEQYERIDQPSFERLLETNREKYCWRYEPQSSALEISFPGFERKTQEASELAGGHGRMDSAIEPTRTTVPPMAEAVIKAPPQPTGRGGEGHVKTQNLIKSIANQYGWRANLEHAVEQGSVDVWLERGDLSIACEINVTTSIASEQQNIVKCLSADADEVWIIGENAAKLLAIGAPFKDDPQVYVFSPDDVPAEIEARSDIETGQSSEVRGFTVTIKKAYVSALDLETRRARLEQLFKAHR